MPNHRATEWLLEYGRRYPDAWTQYARFLAAPPEPWPRWCFCPIAGAYAIVSGGRDKIPLEQGVDVSALAALAAWRATQGIYRIDETLFAELWRTPLRGDLPIEVFERMPEWCVYIELPQGVVDEALRGHGVKAVHGFFVFLEHDANTSRRELRLLLDTDEALVPAVIHLSGTLEDGIHDALVESRVQALRGGRADFAPPLRPKEQVRVLEGYVSVLLYLCADDAEIADRQPLPTRAWEQKRKGPALIAPSKPVIHETGVRLGSALFDARQAYEHSSEGTGRGVEPHVRRAHWHSYWTGPRTGERKLVLRWLSPILVAMEGVPEVPTVRPVKDVP